MVMLAVWSSAGWSQELTPAEAQTIAREAYVYGFPIVENYRRMYAAAIDTRGEEFCPLHRSIVTGNSTNVALIVFAQVKDESFATAVCGVIDSDAKTLRFSSAGGPPVVVFRSGGGVEQVERPGLPFGVVEDTEYEEACIDLCAGDSILLFTDGVFEVQNAQGEILGIEGLVQILRDLDYPESFVKTETLEEALLKFSNAIRLDDDVTFIEARLV